MKYNKYILLLIAAFSMVACNDVIDLSPQSNLNTATFYSTVEEFQTGLNGCYNGMQQTVAQEWQFTELRSDNTKQGNPASTSSTNRDISDLDMFLTATTHQAWYNYWLASYNNIRNANIILDKLGAKYDPASGNITLGAIAVPMEDAIRKQLIGEALFIRAYHYFNLVRLAGGVFLVHTPISAAEAKQLNRVPVADIYKLIEADLKTATTYLSTTKFASILAINRGKASAWAAKAMLGKVYLTLNRKADAITQLQDVVTNSGHSLVTPYANIFSTSNELNAEIIFAIRFKAGGLGLGSRFGNDFAPLNSGAAVINGSGLGYNYPTNELDTAWVATDVRKAASMATFGTGATASLYVRKFLSPVVLTNDGESDFPVLRYADVLLMLAEAQGNSAASVALIKQVRTRAALPDNTSSITNVATFESALANERRFEFAFENQRWFDLVRFNTTLTTIKAETTIKNHFAIEYLRHYATYPAPILKLSELQALTTTDRLLLPIPQREIDTNTNLVIPQNPGY